MHSQRLTSLRQGLYRLPDELTIDSVACCFFTLHLGGSEHGPGGRVLEEGVDFTFQSKDTILVPYLKQYGMAHDYLLAYWNSVTTVETAELCLETAPDVKTLVRAALAELAEERRQKAEATAPAITTSAPVVDSEVVAAVAPSADSIAIEPVPGQHSPGKPAVKRAA